MGHKWDEGHTVTNSTCDAEGVIEYHCLNDGCTEKMIKATSATGHTPGKAATCTEPQVCEVCGTVLELPTGHHYDGKVIALSNCIKQYSEVKIDDAARQIKELQRRNAQLEEENLILKNAITIFTPRSGKD